jgi:hypothetical protein
MVDGPPRLLVTPDGPRYELKVAGLASTLRREDCERISATHL